MMRVLETRLYLPNRHNSAKHTLSDMGTTQNNESSGTGRVKNNNKKPASTIKTQSKITARRAP
jgi:hypothetical protein